MKVATTKNKIEPWAWRSVVKVLYYKGPWHLELLGYWLIFATYIVTCWEPNGHTYPCRCFIGCVCKTKTRHWLLSIKRKFPNDFMFTLGRYLRRKCTKSKKGLVTGIVNSYGLTQQKWTAIAIVIHKKR